VNQNNRLSDRIEIETPGRNTMRISRRGFVTGITGIGLASTVAPYRARAGDGPIRIGLLTVKTGPLASGGIDMERALVMFLKERDYTMSGRKVELVTGDTAGVPATARTKTQEMVEKNKVHCLIGPLAAFEALAIDDYIRQTKIPTLSVAAAEDMTQRNPNPWFVRATSTSSQCAHPLREYAAKELKYKKMITIA
jgi:branched-chain amino acid transport system substrate-binding protein